MNRGPLHTHCILNIFWAKRSTRGTYNDAKHRRKLKQGMYPREHCKTVKRTIPRARIVLRKYIWSQKLIWALNFGSTMSATSRTTKCDRCTVFRSTTKQLCSSRKLFVHTFNPSHNTQSCCWQYNDASTIKYVPKQTRICTLIDEAFH